MKVHGAEGAVALKIAEQYVDAFSNLAKESNTIIIPSDANDVSGFISKSLGVFNAIKNKKVKKKESA